jgi:hypothetical protein
MTWLALYRRLLLLLSKTTTATRSPSAKLCARLQWQPQDLVQFIAEQFDGRRYHQLSPDEVTLLLYRLSVLEILP